MAESEHTDLTALDDMWRQPIAAPPGRPWFARLWRWITEDLFAPFEPVEPLEPLGRHAPIPRRLRIYKRSLKMAKWLRRYREDEAREILAVTTTLLGFEQSPRAARRAGERVRG